MTLHLFKQLRWPPRGLGLGTPLNSALASAQGRARFAKALWSYVVVGIGTAAAMVVLDRLLFAGVSRQRIQVLGALSPLARSEIILFSAVAEEIVYRLGISTLAACAAAWLLSRRGPSGKTIAVWIGIVVAAILFGFAHVANLPSTGIGASNPRSWRTSPPTPPYTLASRASVDFWLSWLSLCEW
jgi:hypothetical protein